MKRSPKAAYRPRRSAPRRVEESGISAYLVEANSYEAMQRRLQLLEGLARGEEAVVEGRIVSHQRAKKRLARWR